MALDQTARRSRRAVLAAAVGGAAAVAAGQLARPLPTVAADPNDVVLNQDNASVAPTSITQSTWGNTAFVGTTSGPGTGVSGHSPEGVGVAGSTAARQLPAAVGYVAPIDGSFFAEALANLGDPDYEMDTGLYGWSSGTDYASGVLGESVTGAGVLGWGQWGVIGWGWPGVLGSSGAGTGVHGHGGATNPPVQPAKTGVLATCAPDGVALDARGKVKFSRSSRSKYFLAGRSSLKVTMTGVTSSSYVLATLQSKRTGIYVQSVVCSSGYFTIYLNKAVSSKTYVAFLVIN